MLETVVCRTYRRNTRSANNGGGMAWEISDFRISIRTRYTSSMAAWFYGQFKRAALHFAYENGTYLAAAVAA